MLERFCVFTFFDFLQHQKNSFLIYVFNFCLFRCVFPSFLKKIKNPP
nr:MAG TPA: hypothetical protein [Caudoviricetes sp.]